MIPNVVKSMRHYKYLRGVRVNVEVYLSQWTPWRHKWEWTYRSRALLTSALGGRVVVSFTLQPFCLRANNLWNVLCRRFYEPQSQSGRFGELNILFRLLEVQQKFLGCPYPVMCLGWQFVLLQDDWNMAAYFPTTELRLLPCCLHLQSWNQRTPPESLWGIIIWRRVLFQNIWTFINKNPKNSNYFLQKANAQANTAFSVSETMIITV